MSGYPYKGIVPPFTSESKAKYYYEENEMTLTNEKEAQRLCNESPYNLDGTGIEWAVETNDHILVLVNKAIELGKQIEAETFAERIAEIYNYLNDPIDEPFPNGTESDRLHYWRTKAIRAAHSLKNISTVPIQSPKTEKLERRVDALTVTVDSLTGMVDRMLSLMESQRKVDAARRGRGFLWEETT